VDVALAHFADPSGGFFDTADDGERLVVRPRDPGDNATPSGGAMLTTVLLRLGALTGEARYRAAAEAALATVGPLLARYPTGFAQWLCALELAHAPLVEIAIVGDGSGDDTRRLLDVAGRYRPFACSRRDGAGRVCGAPAPAGSPCVPRDGVRAATRLSAAGHEPEALEALLVGQ
jgi:uncharacterized protein YyaL (SSP411 family)